MTLLACLLALGSALQASGRRPDVDVRLEAVADPDPSRVEVRVEIEVQGDADGLTEFAVSPEWGGVTAGGVDLTDGRARSADGEELEAERLEPHGWLVRHEPSARIVFAYRLPANDHRAAPSPGRHRRPLVEPGLFHTVGHLALALPLGRGDVKPVAVRLRWIGLDALGWEAMSSLGAGPGPHELEATPDELRQSLFVAGDLRVHRVDLRGRPLYVSLHGAWRFEDRDFVDAAAEIVELERAFFDDFDRPPYWISVIPVGPPDPGGLSLGGTGLWNSFSLALGRDAELDPDRPGGLELVRLLAHETFHEWNGLGIRRRQPEELVYWFSEGFTDFYARRLLLRAGRIDERRYAELVNESIAEYWKSPARDAPNERIREDFWRDRDVGLLPYRRGDLVAMLVDAAVRRASGGARSLDDVLRELLRASREDGLRFDTAALLDVFAAHAGPALAEHVRAVIEDGALPELPLELFEPCLAGEVGETWTWDPGFDLQRSLEESVVRGVVPGSAAHAAGLRDGQELTGWSVHYGDVEREIALQLGGDGPGEVRWLPRGERLEVPRFHPREGADCSGL